MISLCPVSANGEWLRHLLQHQEKYKGAELLHVLEATFPFIFANSFLLRGLGKPDKLTEIPAVQVGRGRNTVLEVQACCCLP